MTQKQICHSTDLNSDGAGAAPTFEECVSQIQRNSYHVCLGRDVSGEGAYIIEDVHNNHVLLLGGSATGKSSQAAQIIDQLCRTHDCNHLHIALLDLEDQTCRLFADLPHIVRVPREHGEMIKAIARSAEEIAVHLGELVALMHERIALPLGQSKRLPKILVSIEELPKIKQHLKSQPTMLAQVTKDVTELLMRGLKVGIHLMVSSQDCYSQDELGVMTKHFGGIKMAFSIQPELSRAAGFSHEMLLAENHQTKRCGQFALESPRYATLVLAPQYDVKAKLQSVEGI
jgi:hypothetical protein